jgi:hypothetical protein
VPVLLMAGAFEPVDEDRSRAIGCDGVIVKPFEPQHLVDRVKELLADQHDSPGKTQGPDAVASSPKPPAPAALKKVMTMPAAGPTADELRRESTPRTTSLSSPPPPTPPSAPASAPVSSAPVELELPDRPAWEPEPKAAESAAPAPAAAAPAAPAPAPAPKVNLVNAFTALLAAEKSSGPSLPAQSPAAPVVPDAAIEEAVRRVLARMTDDLVRRIVLDTAERLIREEIEKIKADPE